MTHFSNLSQEDLDSRTPVIAGNVLARYYDDGMIAWAPTTARPTPLDGVGSVVFQMLDGSATVAELVSDIHEVVGVPKEVARGKLRQVLDQLAADGMIDGVKRTEVAPTKLDLFPAPPNP